MHYSRRRALAAQARSRRAARSPGLRRSSLGLSAGGRGLSYGAPVPAPEASSAEAEAEKVVRVLSERATAAQAEAVWAEGTAASDTAAHLGALGALGAEPLRSTWSVRAIAALVIPALILLVVWLV